jgi:hypothetical protein
LKSIRLLKKTSFITLEWLKRFAISRLNQQKGQDGVVIWCRMAEWKVVYLAKVLGIIGKEYG